MTGRLLRETQVLAFAVLVAISTLILIAIGAYITSQATGRRPASREILDGVVHKDMAFAEVVLSLGLGAPAI